jgi:hypothetical protein
LATDRGVGRRPHVFLLVGRSGRARSHPTSQGNKKINKQTKRRKKEEEKKKKKRNISEHPVHIHQTWCQVQSQCAPTRGCQCMSTECPIGCHDGSRTADSKASRNTGTTPFDDHLRTQVWLSVRQRTWTRWNETKRTSSDHGWVESGVVWVPLLMDKTLRGTD